MAWLRAYLGLGANIGPRLENLRTALDRLSCHGGIHILTCSRVYETVPVDMDSPHLFLNAVAEIRTSLSPHALMGLLLDVEGALGRDRGCMDRTVDLDILYMEGICMNEPGLTIPHPRLYDRAFVLVPWNEIAPELRVPPGGDTISALLSRLGPGTVGVRPTCLALWGETP